MKKVKTLLVTAIAALSLTACSFEDVGSYASQIGSSIGDVWNSFLELVGIKQKEKPCTHKDENHDGVCDLCGESGLEVVHVDENHDHTCDVCEATISSHTDENNDFECDYCGQALATVDIALDTSKATLAFSLGSAFSAEGVKVIATSEIGSKKELEFTVSEPDMSTVGEKTVVVTYGEGENEKFEYTIEVSYWSEEDLEMFGYVSLTGEAPLPYLPGYNMRVEYELDESEEYILDWAIVADDVDDAAVLEYNNLLLDYSKEVEIQEYNVLFELEELALEADSLAELAEMYGLEEVLNAYVLMPITTVRGTEYRWYNYDEYFLLGINSNGQLVMKNRLNNCAFDGMFDSAIGATRFDGSFSLSASGDILQLYGEIVAECMGNYYSEISGQLVVFPTAGEEDEVYPANLFSEFPFDSSFDDATLALEFEVYFGSEEALNSYFESLLAAGYQYDEETGVYYAGDENYGYFEIFGEYLPFEYNGTTYDFYNFDFFYYAPEEFTSPLTLYAADIGDAFGFDYVVDNSGYEEGYYVSAYYQTAALPEGYTGLDLTYNLAKSLLGLDFYVLEGVEDWDDYYQVTLSDGYACATLYVDSVAQEDGSFLIEGLFYYDPGYTLSNGELEFKSIFGSDLIKGVDYLENVDGSFSMSSSKEVDLENYSLEADCLEATQSLPESYVVASSEGDESSWTIVCNDVQRGFQVTIELSLEGNVVTGKVTVAEHRFVTPEVALVEFLTKHTGEEPASTDYTVSEEDGSASASFAIANGEASAEGLKEAAEALALEFNEAFETLSSAADENGAWVVYLANNLAGVEALVTVSLVEGEGYSVKVETFYHVDKVYTAEEIIQQLTTVMYQVETHLDYGYYYDEESETYYAFTSIEAAGGNTSYNYSCAKSVADALVPNIEPELTYVEAYYASGFQGDEDAVVIVYTYEDLEIDFYGFVSEGVNYVEIDVSPLQQA